MPALTKRLLPRSAMRLLGIAASVLIGTASAGTTAAQDAYPSRPVKIVIPYPAGGPTDIVGRIVTGQMALGGFGQPLVIENRGGASGTIGTSAVAKAAPDGYTVVLGTITTHGVGPHLIKNLPYHVVDSFAPIAQAGVTPLVLAVNRKVPATTVAELVAYMKAHPAAINQSSGGIGSSGHIIGALFKNAAGVDFVHVPYAGSGPSAADLIAGVTDISFDGVPVLGAGIRGGQILPLATTMARRAKAYPDVPTLAESGYPVIDASTWNIFFAPAGTPRPVIDYFAKHVALALAQQSVVDKLFDVGVEATPDTTPERAAAFARSEYERWGPLVKQSGATME